jgi:acyl dehydratase
MAFEKDDKRNKVTDGAQVSTMKFTDIAVNPALDEGRFVKPVAKNP